MYLRTLGALELQDAEYARPKALLLLSYLALEGRRNRRHLSTLFFGQTQDALGSLRITLSRLRHALPGTIDEQDDALDVHLECDARSMLTQLDSGDEQGLELYQGAFLAGVQLPELGVELEEWVYATREYLAGRVRGMLMVMALRAAGREDFGRASRLAERAAWLEGAAEPTPEQFVSMGHLLSAGESPLLERLRQQARSFEVTVVGSTEEARLALRVAVPADINREVRALPLRSTPFVGRTVERAEVVRALDRTDVRLLTLVGPGGIGKTRLALEVAREAQSQGTVAFVSVEATTSLFPLPGVIAAAFGVTLPSNLPPFEALVQTLKERSVLLVIDSVEHLLKGASYLSELLRACPGVTVLVTSRERLGLEEEFVLTLGGLTVPPTGAAAFNLRQTEAVELFVGRARRARLEFELTPDVFTAVCEVCALVGGSPLGIELAAAWVRLMSVPDIAEEIRRSLDFLEATDAGVPARHHSVRVVFEQTWARLSGRERTVLTRLSVFRGGFTREAAGWVADATLPTLAGLVDRSLVRVAEHGRMTSTCCCRASSARCWASTQSSTSGPSQRMGSISSPSLSRRRPASASSMKKSAGLSDLTGTSTTFARPWTRGWPVDGTIWRWSASRNSATSGSGPDACARRAGGCARFWKGRHWTSGSAARHSLWTERWRQTCTSMTWPSSSWRRRWRLLRSVISLRLCNDFISAWSPSDGGI